MTGDARTKFEISEDLLDQSYGCIHELALRVSYWKQSGMEILLSALGSGRQHPSPSILKVYMVPLRNIRTIERVSFGRVILLDKNLETMYVLSLNVSGAKHFQIHSGSNDTTAVVHGCLYTDLPVNRMHSFDRRGHGGHRARRPRF